MRLASKIVIIGLALWLAAAMLFFLNASQACRPIIKYYCL